MVRDCVGADLVHSHTWYANMAGHMASLLDGMPHVVTAHSLEPMRPWKAEQLGGGYRVSSLVERTAYEGAAAVIAVREGMREDILRSYPSIDPERVNVVHNGIDSQLWQRDRRRGHRPPPRGRPRQASVIFVGRITRQKGLPYLLRAAAKLPPTCSSCCAPARRTPRRSWPRSRASWTTCGRSATGSCGSPRCCPARGRGPAEPRHRVRVPLHLRAARHRQPRGDGLRAGRGGHRHRRHPRGGVARRDRLAGADRAGAGRHRHPRRPRPVRRRPRGSPQRGGEDPARADRMGLGGPHASHRLLLVGHHRRPHDAGLPRRPPAPGGPPTAATARRASSSVSVAAHRGHEPVGGGEDRPRLDRGGRSGPAGERPWPSTARARGRRPASSTSRRGCCGTQPYARTTSNRRAQLRGVTGGPWGPDSDPRRALATACSTYNRLTASCQA